MLVSNAEELLYDFFADLWSSQTASPSSDWSPENPAAGQSVPTALAIQKFLGGDIVKCTLAFREKSGTESHYWNVIGEEEFDITFDQYRGQKIAEEIFGGIVSRDDLLTNADTRKSYEIFMDAMNKRDIDPISFFSSLRMPKHKG